MTRTRSQAVVLLFGLALGLPACVPLKRTPEARFFYLRTLAEPQAAPKGDGELVGVMPARLPGYLARPQLVTRVAPGELRIDEFLRWAEPLDSGVTRALTADLANLLPEYRVTRFPWRSTATSAAARCRVVVELTEFGLGQDHVVRLAGRFTLLPPQRERAFVIRPVSLQRGPLPAGAKGVDPGGGVDAMSALLEELSREIAAAVRALPAAAPAASAAQP